MVEGESTGTGTGTGMDSRERGYRIGKQGEWY
jgi:hypothetical protein